MGNSAAKQHIETAKRTGTCNLAKQNLTEFPGAVLGLNNNLRTLDISENKLPSLPPAMGSFQILKNLNVSSNRLGHLPDELGNLKKLETLNVSQNRIQLVPSTFYNLHHLRDINLSANRITSFPTALGGLKNLNSVDLSQNKMTEVSSDVKHIQAIEINLNQNQISKISECIAECPRLKVLRLEENCLELTALTPKILKDSGISTLAIEGNLFEMKKFHNVEGYDEYMERYTATKKKM